MKIQAQNMQIGSDANIHVMPNIYSPNAYNLGKYGQIPVSYFNGTAEFSIPLYEFNYRDISIPISANYNASGNRPDNQPGWVGLGWNLQHGGSIIRNTNGVPDEYRTGLGGAVSGYYGQKSYLAATDWKTNGMIPLFDGPDEFSFNFLGLSGDFYLDHTGKWRVQSKQGTVVKIESEPPQAVVVANPGDYQAHNLLSAYTKFVITDANGIKYTFGGDNATEYVRSPSMSDAPHNDGNDLLLVCNVWHLQKIESPRGIVTFNYNREFSSSQRTYSEMHWDDNLSFLHGVPEVSFARDINWHHRSINYTSYLSGIETDDGTSIVFSKSPSNELQFPTGLNSYRVTTTHDPNTGAPTFGGIISGFYGYMNVQPKFFKLDNIVVRNNLGVTIKSIKFDYVENPQERLKLSQLSFISESSSLTGEVFKFEYNSQKLPAYNMAMEDHWGYYNGRNYWNSQSSEDWSNSSFPDVNAYYQYRETDPNYLQAEMLTKVIHPTGGTTEFFYEPHDYSKIVEQYPSSLNTLSLNKTAGGLRIKKIISRADVNNLPLVTEYYYRQNYLNGGTLSSGVLSGEPIYFEEGQTDLGHPDRTFGKFSSDALNYLNHTNGSHVTYSEVVEAISQGQGGYVCYKYTNHDNGYMDVEPFDVISLGWSTKNIGIAYNKSFGKLDLERGLLLEKQYYTSSKSMVRKEVFEYNDDADRYLDYVRGYQYNQRIASVSTRVTYPIFTFWPFLKAKINYEFDLSNGQSIVTKKSFFYNQSRQLIHEHQIASSGETINKYFKYPNDYPADPVLSAMSDLHILSPIVEESKFKNELFLERATIDYHTPHTGLYLPSSIKVQNSNNPIRVMRTFSKYDARGNLLETSKSDDYKEVFMWDYRQNYVVAAIKNAESSTVSYTSFEADGAGNWLIGSIDRVSDGITGSKCYQVSNGITRSNLNSSTEYILTYWLKNGTALAIEGTQGNIIEGRSVGDWKCYMHRISGKSQLSISGTGLIDELRLYPQGAQMTTYTHTPLVGMTTQCDPNNRVIYYEYDGLGRLKVIRDQDKNILKTYDYQFQAVTHGNAVWTATGSTRCKPCPANSAYGTNIKQNEEKDTNPNSSTYDQFRWVDAGTSSNCVINADWQFTTTAIRCKQAGGENTGEQEREQKDLNPCSQTYNTLRWVVTGVNTSACPMSYVYARITLTNPGGGFSDVVVAFFEDAACTMPVSVTNLVVNWQEEEYNDLQGTSTFNSYSTTCNGTETVLAYGAALYGPGPGQAVLYRYYSLLSGTGYAPTN